MLITAARLRSLIREALNQSALSFEAEYPLDQIIHNPELDNAAKTWLTVRNWTEANPALTLARGIHEYYAYDQARAASMNRALAKIDRSLQGVFDREMAAAKTSAAPPPPGMISLTTSMEKIAELRGINNAISQIEDIVGPGRFMEAVTGLLPPPRATFLTMRVKEAEAEQGPALEQLRIELGLAAPPPPPEIRPSRGIEYADEETVAEELRSYIKNNLPPSEPTRAAIQRYLRQSMNGEPHNSFRALFREPSSDEDPYAYRGINISEDALPRFGVDPTGLPRGVWVLLGPDESESHGDMPSRPTPIPREMRIPNQPGATVSSWSYSAPEARMFASQGPDSNARLVLAADMFGGKNEAKFLEMYGLYEALDLDRFDDEVELLGVASAANPIRGRAMYVWLPE